jgi:NADH/F420H2 dehydrogenase subunit C
MKTLGTDYTKALVPATAADISCAQQSTFDWLASRFPLDQDPLAKLSTSAIVRREDLHEVVQALRDTPEFAYDMLIDIIGIDYLNYPGHQGPRFAVTYLFKSMRFAAHRFQLKVLVDEEDLVVPSLHDLFHIANWAEREVWDLFGIRFEGHPNMKRLLNHFEFVGHPLRKDYPAQKRQWLSTNDPLLDQLEARLRENGMELIDPIPLNTPAVEDVIKGSRR